MVIEHKLLVRGNTCRSSMNNLLREVERLVYLLKKEIHKRCILIARDHQ